MKKKIGIIVILFVLFLSSVMIVGSIYYSKKYADQEFDQILYYILHGVQGTSSSVVKEVIQHNILAVIILFFILVTFIIRNLKEPKYINLKIKGEKKNVQIYPIKITSNNRIIFTTVIFVLALITTVYGFKINTFVKYNLQKTNFYEKYYVDGSNVEIKFPHQKRNLIIISVESLENSLCSKENGGGWNYSVIPELEQLATENINFSHNEKIGGYTIAYGTGFTSGGLVAYTAGIPLITPATLKNSNSYVGSGKYLENAYTLGDILKKEGYNLEIMMGSDGNFGGRTQYFITNGEYKIFDLNYAIATGKMTENEKVWWGFEDDRLFKWAKEETIELASKEKPFNLIIHTADTHFVDGYLSTLAENKYENKYENVHAYASKLTNDFVNWLKEQDFYENTTIVILGDHLGMQSEFYAEHIDEKYERTVYNTIINSAIEPENTTNRKFTTMDMYPTILASMGVQIEGERLGLGTNLFSGEKTLVEELGYDYVDKELRKKSDFYNNALLGDDYKLIKDLQMTRTKEDIDAEYVNNTY